jgi:type VI protein secretion system component VasK
MKNEKNKSGKPNNIKDTIRNMAALYLIYLAYKMISDIVKGNVTDIKPALGISIAIVFAAFGIIFIINSYKKAKRDKKRQLEEAQAEAQAEAEAKKAENNSSNLLEAQDHEADKDIENPEETEHTETNVISEEDDQKGYDE